MLRNITVLLLIYNTLLCHLARSRQSLWHVKLANNLYEDNTVSIEVVNTSSIHFDYYRKIFTWPPLTFVDQIKVLGRSKSVFLLQTRLLQRRVFIQT